MAKASITMTCPKCGKEYVWTAIKANRRDANSWEQWASGQTDRLCPECYAEERKAAREAEHAESKKAGDDLAKNLGLVDLTGSERQIAWAVSIRGEVIRGIANRKPKERFMAAVVTVSNRHADAKWWIENRIYAEHKIMQEAKPEFIRAMPREAQVALLEDTKSWIEKYGSSGTSTCRMMAATARADIELLNSIGIN